jgi:hypothetical protein
MFRDAVRRGFLAHWALFLLATAAVAQTPATDPSQVRRSPDFRQVLSWLPPDTETIVVANKVFPLADLRDVRRSREFHLEAWLRATAVAPLWFKNGSLLEYFKDGRARFALAGSRHFRAPKSLGLMPFEGCTIVFLSDDIGDRADAFFSAASGSASRVEDVEGQKILVFQERADGDLWTTFVTFRKPNVLLVATNLGYLRDVLARMRNGGGPRALPETLPEWKHVNVEAQSWGLRHYDRSQADSDPSSPFWDPRKSVKAPLNDAKAIGLTFSYDPANGKGPIITYVSGNANAARKALAMPQESTSVSVVFRELDAGTIEAAYGPGRSTDAIFGLLLPYLLGHGIFL